MCFNSPRIDSVAVSSDSCCVFNVQLAYVGRLIAAVILCCCARQFCHTGVLRNTKYTHY